MGKRHRQDEPGTEIVLPITPMLDMSFQLLFFFMATFNPTDPEGAQTLAVAKEIQKKKEDEPPKDEKKVDAAKNKDKIDPTLGKTPPKETVEVDNDLRLFIKKREQGGNAVTLSEGAIKVAEVAELYTVEKIDNKEKKKFNEELIKQLTAKLEERKKTAETAAKAEVQARAEKGEKVLYDDVLKVELAKQMKVRLQTQADTQWGDVFDAMNLCTRLGKEHDLAVVPTLTTPEGWVPKVEPKP